MSTEETMSTQETMNLEEADVPRVLSVAEDNEIVFDWHIFVKAKNIMRTNVAQYLIEKYDVSHGDVQLLFCNVLEKRRRYPEATKDEIVGCMCPYVNGGWNADIQCKKEKSLPIVKIPVECSPCDNDCPICFDLLSEDVVKTSCGHQFHRECLEKVKNPENFEFKPCPLCRNKVSTWTMQEARASFDAFKDCCCCERHQTYRPTFLSPDAPWIEPRGCGSAIAIVLRRLLDFNDSRTLKKLCACRDDDGTSCRSKVRTACSLVQ
jgi:hypothetical protein